MTMETAASSPSEKRRYKLHWHILFTHFPIGTVAGAFLFMGLHLITRNGCYAQAAYVSLIAGAAILIPTTATGWYAWKRTYKGSDSKLFRIKIWTSAVMIPLSVALVVYQGTHPFTLLDVGHSLAHAIYLLGVVLLMIGGVIEGFWGARLHHR